MLGSVTNSLHQSDWSSWVSAESFWESNLEVNETHAHTQNLMVKETHAHMHAKTMPGNQFKYKTAGPGL